MELKIQWLQVISSGKVRSIIFVFIKILYKTKNIIPINNYVLFWIKDKSIGES